MRFREKCGGDPGKTHAGGENGIKVKVFKGLENTEPIFCVFCLYELLQCTWVLHSLSSYVAAAAAAAFSLDEFCFYPFNKTVGSDESENYYYILERESRRVATGGH